ncbi:MAG: four-carbon acid sugar kinase family protein [Pseudomonadota bacterium]
MTVVRLLADDLTGALDTAGPFARAAGPLPVVWGEDPWVRAAGSVALDSETREALEDVAVSRVRRCGAALVGADIAFKKIDSLLRGHPAAEIAACLAGGRFATVVVAPAFPAQRRITWRGQQYFRTDDDRPWTAADCRLPDALAALGHKPRLAASAEAIAGGGVILCDAESDADLEAVARAGDRLDRPVLWCGCAGLGRALAARLPAAAASPAGPLPRPRLAVVGSSHPAAQAQVARLAATGGIAVVAIGDARDIESAVAHVAGGLKAGADSALVFRLPPGTERRAAGGLVSAGLAVLVGAAPRPGGLAVTGGDTLFRLCLALGASAMTALGEPAPGLARSALVGGAWDGLPVVSKSGAFGGRSALADMLAGGAGTP